MTGVDFVHIAVVHAYVRGFFFSFFVCCRWWGCIGENTYSRAPSNGCEIIQSIWSHLHLLQSLFSTTSHKHILRSSWPAFSPARTPFISWYPECVTGLLPSVLNLIAEAILLQANSALVTPRLQGNLVGLRALVEAWFWEIGMENMYYCQKLRTRWNKETKNLF